MAMVIAHNNAARLTLGELKKNTNALGKQLKKVSSGMKINSASDDASMYAISERMRVQIRSLDQDWRNTQTGTNLLDVADGAVSSTVEILRTMKEKALSAANDTNTDSDRATMQKEYNQLIDQIDDNANVTFNGHLLVDGSNNRKVIATQTSLTNNSLSTNTTGQTAFTAMQNRQGEELFIDATDTVEISWTKNGETHSASVTGADNIDKLLETANATVATGGTTTTTVQTVYTVNGVSTTDANDVGLDLNSWRPIEYDESYSGEFISDFSIFGPGDQITLSLYLPDRTIGTGQYGVSQSFHVIRSAFTNFIEEATLALTAGPANAVIPLSQPMHEIFDGRTYLVSDPSQQVNAAYCKYKTVDLSPYSRLISIIDFCDDSMRPLGVNVDRVDGTQLNEKYLTVFFGGIANLPGAGWGFTYSLKVSSQENTTTTGAVGNVFESTAFDGSSVGTDASGSTVYTPDSTKAITIRAYESGVDGQVAGVTFLVKDSEGKIKRNATEALNSFSETVRAENASEDNALIIHTGTKANQAVKVYLTDMRSVALGLKSSDGKTLSIGTQACANTAISVIDSALQKALNEETRLGAYISRLKYTASNLTTANENTQASESTIRDADMAKEMVKYTKANVLAQASQSMLAQANQNSASVLNLLQ